ncbi:hypothetical protein PG991_015914 [Apiospora marii]|uniref:Uncharacterized protein n=1 Tax=Apiospora marii TaxID=335849 RepID=A0ABR1R088_9PEZI
MADSSDKERKRTTRAAAASSSQAAADSPKPPTSGKLNYRPRRIWKRRQRAKGFVEQQLPQTAFVFLEDENEKSLLLEAIDKCLTDDINHFVDNSRPRDVYSYALRAHAAIETVFRDNLALFKGLGVEGTNKEGEDVDGFGNVVVEPVLDELFLQDEEFFLEMNAPQDDSDDEMEDAPASSKD